MDQIVSHMVAIVVGILLGVAIAFSFRPTSRVSRITEPPKRNPPAGPFKMIVDEVRQLRPGWEQAIVGGTVSEGKVQPGNTLFVKTERYIPVRVIGIARNQTTQEQAKQGEWVELLLGGVRRDQIEPADVLTDVDNSRTE